MRRGIDGLVAMIRGRFHLDPCEGRSIFLFCGKRTDRIKAIVYEGDGFLLLYKRLADGNFQWPRSSEEAILITEQQFRWLMEGLSISQKKVIKDVHPKIF